MIDNPQVAIKELQTRESSLLTWLDNVQVSTKEEQHYAEDMLISAKRAVKEAEEERKRLTKPLDETKAGIITLFKPYIERLQTGIGLLNTALFQYHEKQRIEAEAARLAALAEQAARIAAAKDTGEMIEPLARATEPEVATTSHAHLGSVTYREDYDIQIIRPNDVPRDLCEPSMSKIRARVKSGVTDIPGVLVSKKYISVARTEGSYRKEESEVPSPAAVYPEWDESDIEQDYRGKASQ